MSELEKISAVCITLDERNPDRAQRAFAEIQNLGFRDVSFVDGIRGIDLSEMELKNLMTPRAYFELKNKRYVHEALSGVGSVGCYLSHTKVWKECLMRGEPLAIFEDDFVAKPSSREIMEISLKEAHKCKFDVLRFQHRHNHDYGEKLESLNSDNISRVIRTEGLCAYIITPRAAKFLLDNAFPLDAQVDHYLDMGCFYHNLNNYTTIPDLFDDPQKTSTVDHNSLELYQDGFNSTTYNRHHKCIWVIVILLFLIVVLLLYYRRDKK